jgi:hypothetical protein
MNVTTIAHGATLNRYPIDSNPDSVGTVQLWERPVHEIYAALPFAGLFRGLTVEALHIDRPEAEPLRNYSAVGLSWPGQRRIQFSVHATRPPELAALTFAHEFGHFHQHECRLKLSSPEPDDITREIRRIWDARRPGQGHNTAEDWAEVFRAVAGCDQTRGTYSDNKRAALAPELVSLMRCAYWLSLTLQGQRVESLQPGQGGCLYRLRTSAGWLGFGDVWRWRWIDAITFRSQEWDGQKWILI